MQATEMESLFHVASIFETEFGGIIMPAQWYQVWDLLNFREGRDLLVATSGLVSGKGRDFSFYQSRTASRLSSHELSFRIFCRFTFPPVNGGEPVWRIASGIFGLYGSHGAAKGYAGSGLGDCDSRGYG